MNIWEAALNADIPRIQELLAQGVDINSTHPEYGSTPLMFAAERSNTTSSLETVKFLLNNGADVNFKNSKSGGIALTFAVKHTRDWSSLDTVKLLLDRGANVNLQYDDSYTALMTASKYSNTTSSLDTVKLLIDRGADVNLIVNTWSPLMVASKYSNTTSSLDTVKLLIDRGADVNFKGPDGWTALRVSAANTTSNLETVKLLLESGADPFIDLNPSILESKELIIEYRWKRLSLRDKQTAEKYNKDIPISKDVWLLIMRHKRQQQLCSNLQSEKNKEILKYFALELEIPLEEVKNMNKAQLCGVISRQITYKDFDKFQRGKESDKAKLLEVARRYGIDITKPTDQILNDLAKMFQ